MVEFKLLKVLKINNNNNVFLLLMSRKKLSCTGSEVWGLNRSLWVSLGCRAQIYRSMCSMSMLSAAVCLPVSRSVSQSVCLWLRLPRCHSAVVFRTRTFLRSLSFIQRGSGRIMLRWSPVSRAVAAWKKTNQNASLCACAWKKTSLRGEMSAVSPEQVQTGEPSRTVAEADPQKAGILQPQTVFVILDSSEAINLVRWVRKFGKYRSSRSRQTSFKKSVLSNPAALVSPSLTWNPRNRLPVFTDWVHSVLHRRIWL